jgi:hypothetical protein
MKEDERCRACGTNGAEGECIQGFGGEPEGERERERERQHRLGNNNEIYLKEIECEVVDRIDVAENSDRWWAFVNKVMNI